jgi:hypothetical protein
MRIHNPSKRAAVDPRIKPHGHWDRPLLALQYIISIIFFTFSHCIALNSLSVLELMMVMDPLSGLALHNSYTAQWLLR